LPWYRVTRAESALLHAHAADVIAGFAQPMTITELGCGNGEKLEIVLEQGQPLCRQLHLIDISSDALDQARARLARRGPIVTTCRGTYEDGLARLESIRRDGEPLLVLFLGSNIGNFDPEGANELLAAIRSALRPGDGLLLGSDLVKPARDLMLAYADPLGVTAAFNLNVLRRLNEELGADFDLGGFAHEARWNAAARRVEMHLVSLREQLVHIAAAGLTLAFVPGETIWTESSYKYDPAEIVRDGRTLGFANIRQWMDEDAGFALTCFTV
jgi:L-histidine Nalpha-methyltransferase